MAGKRKTTASTLPHARFDVQGAGSAAFTNIAAVLGSSVPQVVGWCEVDVNGENKPALVLSQSWPFLPFGADPLQVIKQRRYVAVVPSIDEALPDVLGFQVIEIAAPPVEKVRAP